ncbi:MAG: 1-acyl-sn-glycerol-3-phosphate acyltransferase [Planctomycetota bacterium]|jgi:1-acyl-sn-glycerol-3-phosphate acyltransferase
MLNDSLRFLFFVLVVKPIILIVVGLNVRNRGRLPTKGPAIIIANHNSHLDTMALMSLFSARHLRRLRPVAAADYFLRSRFMAWFALKIVGIIPLSRRPKHGEDPLAEVARALENDAIIFLFPEGSRGQPEKLSKFKNGIAHLAKRFPSCSITPIFLHGLGKSMPKGEALLVPFFCDVFVGEPHFWEGERAPFMDALQQSVDELAREGEFPNWE